MSSPPRGLEPFVAPNSPTTRIRELERQNLLLREANAVLKHALVGVIERYKQVADRMPSNEQALESSSGMRDVYDEGVDQVELSSKARSLEDITTNVIQAVVRRFAEPSSVHSPRRGGSIGREMERRERQLDVERILRCIEETSATGLSVDEQTPSRPRETFKQREASERDERFLSRGVSLVNPSIPRGEEMRVKITGSPNIVSQDNLP